MSDSPPLRDHIGTRLRSLREGAGMSREELARRVAMTPDYIKQIEGGRRPVQKLSTIVHLGHALQLSDLGLLTGSLGWTLARTDEVTHPATDKIAALVHRPGMLAPPRTDGPPPPSIKELQSVIDHLWRVWHTTTKPFSTTAMLLPTLLEDVDRRAILHQHAPGEEEQRRRAAALRSMAWTLARQWLRETQASDLAAVAAERALAAAQAADSPLLITFAAWNIVGVHNATGNFEAAESVAADAVAAVGALPASGKSDRVMGMAGALHLYRSIALAHLDDEDAALRSWAKADEISRSLGSAFYDEWTCFSGPNLGLYQVGIQVELGRPQKAADLARRVDPYEMRSIQRQGRYLIDLGRAHTERDEDDAALAVLLQAEALSPEQITYSWYARNTAQVLLRRWRVTNRPELAAFAQRLGVA